MPRSRRGALAEARAEHPAAEDRGASRSARESVLAMADFVGSTSAIIDWCVRSDAPRIHRDDRKRHRSLARTSWRRTRRFYFVANENCNCSECPYMKMNTLEKLRDCLLNLEPRVELSDELMRTRAACRSSACSLLREPMDTARSSIPSDGCTTTSASA